MAQPNQPRVQQPHNRAVAPREGVLARGRFWVSVVLCGVALGACSGSGGGPVAPTGVGPAAKLVFTIQPSNAAAGAGIAPAVQVAVQDAQGNTVTTATTSITVAIAANPASGTLSGTATVAAVNGVATFSTLSLNTAATGYTLTASATGLTSATSSAFNIGAGAAAKLVFTVQPSNAIAGGASTPAVQVAVQDAQGNTVTTATTSITVAIGTNPASGTLAGTTTVAAVNGIATFANVSINNPGTGYTLTASATSLTGATSRSFNITITTPITAGPRLSAGYHSTCGATTGGGAYCWGANEWAQLGNGSLTGSLIPSGVSGGLSFASVSVGSFHPTHTCGVTTSGAAYCWGADSLGELGNGSPTAYSLTPVAVSGGLSFAAVSGGARFTCGVTTSGAGYCWGDNHFGELGNGSTTNSPTPVAVSGGYSFTSVSVGTHHACGVTTGGVAYCWGENGLGELGNGSNVSNSTTPVAVSGGLAFVTVSAGFYFTCGVTTSGAGYCWGDNGYGALGNGSNVSNSTTPVAVSGGLSFATVSAGFGQTCGVTTSGAAYCWGNNQYGQVGIGSTTTPTLTPLAVSGGLSFASVSAGTDFTCGVTTGGAAYCWGHPGALGNGSATSSAIPVAVSGGLSF